MDTKTYPVFVALQNLLKADRANPAGESLEDSGVLDELRSMAKVIPQSEVAGKTVAGRMPDWVAVEARARELLERSIDIRVLIVLAEAGLRTQGVNAIRAFGECISTVADLIENHWEAWYPNDRIKDRIDEEFRTNAICDLRSDQIIVGMRAVRPFATAQLRTIGLADFAPGIDGKPPQLDGVARSLDDPSAALDAGRVRADINFCIDQFRRLQAVMAPRSMFVDLERISRLLGQANEQLTALAGVSRGVQNESDAVAALGADALAKSAASVEEKGGFNREAAKEILQRMINHFVHVEPSSPVPHYLKRAQALIGLEFSEVVRQMGDDVKKFSDK